MTLLRRAPMMSANGRGGPVVIARTTSAASVRHAWMQKHPSPVTDRGEFHWFPAEIDGPLRASFVERAAGLDAPAVLWQLAPGRVAWARLFAATAPSDGRRYTGLVLSIATRDGALPSELLASLTVPPAGPHDAVDKVDAATRLATTVLPGAPAVARAAISGGIVRSDDADLVTPATVAAVVRHLPDEAGEGGVASSGSNGDERRDIPAELLAAVAAGGDGRAWTLLCELARATRRSVDAVAADVAILWADGALTDEERALLAHRGDFSAMLNAWGRGRLDASATADTLPSRLADAVALRALARLLDGDDPAVAIAEARWYALLPADRRAELVGALVQRTPSLLPLLGGARHA